MLRHPEVAETDWLAASDLAREWSANPEPFPEPCPVAKWTFLAALAKLVPVQFHGTSQPDIEEFLPRQTEDQNPFGASARFMPRGIPYGRCSMRSVGVPRPSAWMYSSLGNGKIATWLPLSFSVI